MSCSCTNLPNQIKLLSSINYTTVDKIMMPQRQFNCRLFNNVVSTPTAVQRPMRWRWVHTLWKYEVVSHLKAQHRMCLETVTTLGRTGSEVNTSRIQEQSVATTPPARLAEQWHYTGCCKSQHNWNQNFSYVITDCRRKMGWRAVLLKVEFPEIFAVHL
jgi:hypothetical protein